MEIQNGGKVYKGADDIVLSTPRCAQIEPKSEASARCPAIESTEWAEKWKSIISWINNKKNYNNNRNGTVF